MVKRTLHPKKMFLFYEFLQKKEKHWLQKEKKEEIKKHMIMPSFSRRNIKNYGFYSKTVKRKCEMSHKLINLCFSSLTYTF